MYITTPKRKGGITVVRLVHGFRKDDKVKIKIIKTIGQSRDPEEIKYFGREPDLQGIWDRASSCSLQAFDTFKLMKTV